MRNDFEGLLLTPVMLPHEPALLAGSVVTAKVAAQKVTVEDYDFGFADESGKDAGFDVGFDD